MIPGSFDATVRLWDCKSQSPKPIQVLEEARDSVSTLSIVEYEIVTGSVDGKLRLYDLRMGIVKVDVIGRTSSRRVHRIESDLLTYWTQNQLPLFSRHETEMLSWCPRLTQQFVSWTKPTGRCCKAILVTQTRITASGHA